VSTPVNPALQLGRPPVTPPDMPTLSSVRVGEGPTGPGLSAALPRLFFELSQRIDTIARLLPGQSMQLDEIRSRLQEVLADAVQNPEMGGREENRSLLGSAGQEQQPYMG